MFLTLPTGGGNQETQCITREGVDDLFTLMKTPRDPVKRAAFLEMKKNVLSRWSGNLPTPVAAAKPADRDIRSALEEATSLAEVVHCDPRAFQIEVFRKFDKPEFAAALERMGGMTAPALTHGEPGWYNPSELAALMNDPLLTAERINFYLKNQGFQFKDEDHLWRLTDMGKAHGREYTFRGRGDHREPRIEWRESVLVASGLKRPVSQDQLALPQKASTGA